MSNILSFPSESIEETLDDIAEDEEVPFSDLNMSQPESNDLLSDLFAGAAAIMESVTTNETIELPMQMRCISHLLNLISSDFEKVLSIQAKTVLVTAISKVHAIWNFVHRSAQAKTLCLEIIGCCLPIPCVTRWNSRYDAVAKICDSKIKPQVNMLVQRLSTELSSATHLQVLSNADWIVLNEYIRVMAPIAQAKGCNGSNQQTFRSILTNKLQ